MLRPSKKGNTILLVLIVSTALGAAVFASLRLVRHESTLNKRAYLYHEARLGAETLLQASFADLQNRFENSVAFPKDELAPSNNPLSVPDEFVSKYIGTSTKANTNLLEPGKTTYSDMADFNTEPTEVIGGLIPPGEWRFIDPRVPGNEQDKLAGTMVFIRSIVILAKATVSKTGWADDVTAYTRQYLEVRDAPLFAHAIFYNVPMEIAPGPKMNVYGNVHSNGDMYIQSNSGLYFHGKVSSAGGLFSGRRDETGKSNSSGTVQFTNREGDFISLKEDSTWDTESRNLFGGGFLTSEDDNWGTLASQLFDGNVLSEEHGVQSLNPVGVLDYVEDTDTSTSAKEGLNYAYQVIQPTLPASELSIPDPNVFPEQYQEAIERNEVEKQKFSYNAGLTVSVSNSGSVTLKSMQRDSDGNLVYDPTTGLPQSVEIKPDPSVEFISVENFSSTGNGSSEKVTSGIHDKREKADLNTVEIDVNKLKDAIHSNDSDDWLDGGKPSDWWNGIVYVEFPQQSSTSTREDHVNPAIEGWGVKIKNAETIPNPDFARAKGIYGTSFATNQAMYIEGNYNADGDSDTGSPTEADNNNFAKEGAEAPSALVADAITFLSTNWDDENSARGLNSHRQASNFTEVSAAILAGVVPSGKTGSDSYSGGVENFPRFLEKWSGKTIRIRGSIVALFESEVADAPWGSGDVYSAPNRNWGFHEKLAEGFYPPGTPSTRDYRGRDYRDLSADEYEAEVASIKEDLSDASS